MLLKVLIHESVGVSLPASKEHDLYNWLINEQLPLQHPSQLESLIKAVGLAKDPARASKIDLNAVDVVFNGTVLDVTRTAAALHLKAGSAVTIRRRPPRPRASTKLMTRGSQGGIQSPGDPPLEPDDDVPPPAVNDDEVYSAAAFGWFPFVVSQHGGQTDATFANPDVEPRDDDARPNTNSLCGACADMVQRAEGLSDPVDRHYKPMMMQTAIVEGLVEKLTGSTLPRWTTRYLSISEKSVDWYDSEPKLTAKAKVKGTRMIYDGDKVLLKEVAENPDATRFPKCKDPKYFYFVAVFRDAPQGAAESQSSDAKEASLQFRVPTLELKTKFVGFLRSVLKRAQKTGASRDPVHWKQWADSLLATCASVGAVGEDMRSEESRLLQEIQEKEAELAEVRNAIPQARSTKDGLMKAVSHATGEIQILEQRLLDQQIVSDAASRKVAESRQQYELARAAISDDLSGLNLRCERALRHREALLLDVSRLNEEIEEIEQRHNTIFSQWRKAEEKHKDHMVRSDGPQLSFCLFRDIEPILHSRSASNAATPRLTPRTGRPATPRTGVTHSPA